MDKKNTILVVDDAKENVDALRSILDELYAVRIALNGEAALRSIQRDPPDLILLDVMMPDIDGFEVMQRMKENPKLANIPVIFITGETDVISEGKGLQLGAVDYLTKPYEPDIVYIKVKNQLENKMYRDMLEHLVEKRTQEVTSSREAVIMGMSLLAEGRDQGTGEHIQRMQRYTMIIAERLLDMYPSMTTAEDVKRMILLSPLHDIGKVSVPDAILLKKGKLTNEEFDEMKKHTVFGAEVLRKTESFMQGTTDILEIAVEIAESHHEKYNGAGYPHGLKGDEIPLSARIVAIADVYDALTSERPYKKAFTHEEAMDIILRGDGRTEPVHFDPRLLKVFEDVSEEMRIVNKRDESEFAKEEQELAKSQ